MPPPEQVEAIINELALSASEAQDFRSAAATAHVPEGLRERVEAMAVRERTLHAIISALVERMEEKGLLSKREAQAFIDAADPDAGSLPLGEEEVMKPLQAALRRIGARPRKQQ